MQSMFRLPWNSESDVASEDIVANTSPETSTSVVHGSNSDAKWTSIEDLSPLPKGPTPHDTTGKVPPYLKRTQSEDDLESDDAVHRSMAHRRKSDRPSVDVVHICRDCAKGFKRPCDLTKHMKTHSRPWKCPEAKCKYNELGFPTEKECDRHFNDKHVPFPPMYKCLYPPCRYASKRESNCKQHMEKAHGWELLLGKSNGPKVVMANDAATEHEVEHLATVFRNRFGFEVEESDFDDDDERLYYDKYDGSWPLQRKRRAETPPETENDSTGIDTVPAFGSYLDASPQPASDDPYSLRDSGEKNIFRGSLHYNWRPVELVHEKNGKVIPINDGSSFSAKDDEPKAEIPSSSSSRADHALLRWFEEHPENLSPNLEELKGLAQECGVTVSHIIALIPTVKAILSPRRQRGHLKYWPIRKHHGHEERSDVWQDDNEASVKNLTRSPALATLPATSDIRSRAIDAVAQDSRNSFDKKRQWYIPGTVNRLPVEANPDTGSDIDIVSLAFAKRQKLDINTQAARTIRLPTGRKIKSVGTVDLDFAFRGEEPLYRRCFTVLKNSIHEVILGKSFLDATATLTRGYLHRLKERVVSYSSVFSQLCLLGCPAERVMGTLNGKATQALPDTGSDVTVISSIEAKRLGLLVHTDDSYRTYLQFADGSLEYTEGMVLDAEWRFRSPKRNDGYPISLDLTEDTMEELDSREPEATPSGKGTPFHLDLHVVENLTCDLILSNAFLFDSQAYVDYTTCFQEVHQDYSELDDENSVRMIMERGDHKSMMEFLVKWFRSKDADPKASTPERKAEEEATKERRRQMYEEDCIDELPARKRPAAWEIEMQRRRQWIQDHTPVLTSPSPVTTTPAGLCNIT